MKKLLILLIVWIIPFLANASINECLTDIYFVNGIRSDEGNATANTILLKRAIQKDIFNLQHGEYKKHIGKVKEAYNSTHGFGWDGIETYLQKFGAQWVLDLFFSTAHKADLRKQIKKYKTSIRDGHRVLVVAHSQGNLFANDAYKKILGHKTDWWMTPYMRFVSVASPNCFKITPSTPGVSWDNDIVSNLVDICSADSVDNDVRRVYWIDTKVALVTDPPVSSYVWRSQIGDLLHDDWQSYEPTFQSSIAVHAFTFYMGESLGEKGKEILNGYDSSEMNTTRAKTEIMTAIEAQLNSLENLCNNNTDNSNDNNTTNGGEGDNNSTAGGDDNSSDTGSGNNNSDDDNTTDDPTQDPNKVCVSNYFKYYGDGKIHDSLKKGDKDEKPHGGTKHQVKEMQEFLQAFGYDVGSHGADGWFGSDTKDALIAFQDANGLDADGIVGPNTRDAMNSQNCYDK